MNIFSRILKIGHSEAQAIINQLEDPIKMTEQGIRDLAVELEESLYAVAKVKAMAIRARNDAGNYREKANEYENKAVQLLQRAHRGQIETSEADRLAAQALHLKEQNLQLATQAKTEQEKFEQSVAEMEVNVKNQRATISKWENELRTLKSRLTVSNATKTINKQMAQIDSAGTVTLLERMKEKVAVEEALAESYGELANESSAVDREINETLRQSSYKRTADDVDALKAKLGYTSSPEQH